MHPSEEAKKIAEEIVNHPSFYYEYSPYVNKKYLSDAIVAALTVKPGHVRDERGVERKLLGTPLVTKDGCMFVTGVSVWRMPIVPGDGLYWDTGEELSEFAEVGGVWLALDCHSADVGGLWNLAVPASECYSTRDSRTGNTKRDQ
jgi:hypothetical protein